MEGQSKSYAAAHSIGECGFGLVAFAGIVAGAAGVIAVGAKPMTPTIVHHDGAALDFGDTGHGSDIGLSFRRCDSHGAVSTVVGTVEPSLLSGKLVTAFHIFLIEVSDEIWKGVLCLRTFVPVTTSLCEKACVLEYLQCASDNGTDGNMLLSGSGESLNVSNISPQCLNTVINVEGLLEMFLVGFKFVGLHFAVGVRL